MYIPEKHHGRVLAPRVWLEVPRGWRWARPQRRTALAGLGGEGGAGEGRP